MAERITHGCDISVSHHHRGCMLSWLCAGRAQDTRTLHQEKFQLGHCAWFGVLHRVMTSVTQECPEVNAEDNQ